MKRKQTTPAATGKPVVPPDLKMPVLAEPARPAVPVQPPLSEETASALRLRVRSAFSELQPNPPFIAFYNPNASEGLVNVLILARVDPMADPGKDRVAIRVVSALMDKLEGKSGPYQSAHEIEGRACVVKGQSLDFLRALSKVLSDRNLPPYPMDGIAVMVGSDLLITAPAMRICIEEVQSVLPEPVAAASKQAAPPTE
jgi:hypothetical protein